MINISDRPKPPDPHVRLRRPVFRSMIRNRIRQVAEAQPELARIRIHGFRIKRRSNRRKHRALQPRRRLSVRAQRRFHVHRRNRVIRIELDVVFPAPNHLHRLPGLLCKNGRLHCEIRKRFSAERASQQRDVHRHILFLSPDSRGNRVACPHRTLRWSPHFHFAVTVNRESRRRFHRSMRQQRRIIFRFHNLPALRERRVHIADFAHHFARLPRRFRQLFPERT